MAKLVSGRRTPWVRGPTAVVDAYVLGGASDVYDIYFERVVNYQHFLSVGAHAIIDPIGVTIDDQISSGTAIGAAFTQDTSAGGLLTNYMEFTVLLATSDEGGQVTDTVTIAMQTVVDQGPGGVQAIIQNITRPHL